MKHKIFTTEAEKLEYYQGILMHARSGLHETAMNVFKKYVPEKSSVLDVGAGAGAFSLRLLNSGYDVKALDVETEKWIPEQIKFFKLDINRGIQESLPADMEFDSLCCLEVIEHIENPWELLREIYGLVKPGGWLILSTPNISSFYSRVTFLLKGELHQFNEDALTYGHINPLTTLEIKNIARNTGWKVIEVIPAGYLPIFDFSHISIKKLISNLMRGISYILSNREGKEGWCTVFMFQKISKE